MLESRTLHFGKYLQSLLQDKWDKYDSEVLNKPEIQLMYESRVGGIGTAETTAIIITPLNETTAPMETGGAVQDIKWNVDVFAHLRFTTNIGEAYYDKVIKRVMGLIGRSIQSGSYYRIVTYGTDFNAEVGKWDTTLKLKGSARV